MAEVRGEGWDEVGVGREGKGWWQERQVLPDEGVMEGERGGEGRGWEGQAVGKTQLLLRMLQINAPLSPSILLLPPPQPLLLPLPPLLSLLSLPLFFLLSLFFQIPLFPSLLWICANEFDISPVCVFFWVITISDMITAAVITLTAVDIITARSVLINNTAAFGINYRVG